MPEKREQNLNVRMFPEARGPSAKITDKSVTFRKICTYGRTWHHLKVDIMESDTQLKRLIVLECNLMGHVVV
jgi:hypothetical protein